VIVFFSFLVGTFLTMALIPPLSRLAERRHHLDMPSPRKIHTTPMPRIGGPAMVAGAILPLIMWAPMERHTIAYLIGVLIILVFGIWDDIKGIGYRVKFLGQLVAVLVVVLYGGIRIRFLPFSTLDPLPDVWAIPLTVFALVGITNAINLADGLDGLAGGIVLLGLAMMAILAHMGGDRSLVLVAASVIGSIVGFLRFNTYPARIFMGDAGSQFLGFSAGVLAVLLTQQANTAISPAVALLLLGLPILDTLMVIATRLAEGRSPFKADRKHLHHRLLAIGFSHYDAVFLIYLLQAILVAAAYLLRYERDWLIVVLYATFCVALVVSLRAATATGWRAHRHRSQPDSVVGWWRWLGKDQRILKIAFHLAVTAIICYFLLGALLVESVPRDVGALAWVMLAVLLVLFARTRHQQFSIVERACVYIGAICVVYLVQVLPGALADFSVYRNILFVVIAVAVVIGFRFSEERFRITPMDFLVVFVALLVPNIPEFNLPSHEIAVGIAMLIVLFYGIELVLNNIWRRWDAMRYAMYITFAVLGLRGVTGTLG
jgi:UDP-GlcNAc:undecaprenyl-phosphate/decaprenyl-phosphate GlcNAc-1-phosphate transferase